MGPRSTYKTGDFKDAEYIWQDPVKEGKKLSTAVEDALRKDLAARGLTIAQMVETAWASASTFRSSDNRGGANGARIRLSPQKDWEVNRPDQLQKTLTIYTAIAERHQASVADVIVLGGAVGIEMAFGYKSSLYYWKRDASQEQTDIDSFNLLKPRACGFRNYAEKEFAVSPEEILLDKAQLLGLTPVELTLLVEECVRWVSRYLAMVYGQMENLIIAGSKHCCPWM